MEWERGVLIYDGSCGFCSDAARWVTRRWPTTDPPIAVAWQELPAELADRVALGPVEFARSAWWVDPDHRDEGSSAVARALIAIGGGWGRIGGALLHQPIAGAARLGYLIVARYRHRLPGGTPACRI